MPQDRHYSYDSDYDYDYDSKYTIESKDYSQHSVSITTEDINERDSFSYPRPNDPSKSVSLSWKNLSYQKTKEEKKIIQNVTGYVRPGEVLAIMGPSGDKSTFLDLLAGRKDPKHVSGDIFLNGKPDNIKYVSTYVMKDDALMGVLTVRENIQFAADLCFPTSYSQLEKHARVQNIITEFGLEGVADSKIGTVFVRGISGGEKRRCAIASQVLTLPKIIFLDEPTSGLDSAAAFNVMNAIADLAKKYYLTVIVSIHQPSAETYSLFDKLLLLGHGKTLYFGDREKALTYFETLGYACPPYNNPADHYLKLVNSDFMKDITEAEQNITTFSDSFSNSHYKVDTDKQIDEIIEKSSDNNDQITKKTHKRYARSFSEQTFILMNRSYKNAKRNILMFWIRVAMYTCLALFMGTAWWQVGYHQKHVQDRLSAHFTSVAFLSFMSVAGIPGFLEERLVFQRERSNGFYSVGPYVLANTLVSISFINIIAVSFSIITYSMIGLHSFMNFIIFLSLDLFVAESMVVFISATIPIFVAALTINIFANGFSMVIGGYFVRKDAIPKILKLAHYFDYQKYTFEAIIKNDLEGLTFNCDKDPNVLGNCNCIYGGKNSTFTCHSSGQDVLNYFGYTEIDFFKWGLALIGFSLAFRVGLYLILFFRKGRH